MSVSIAPGAMSSSRTPKGASSVRSDSLSAETAALLARYDAKKGTGRSVEQDVMLQRTLPLAWRSAGIARRVTSIKPNRLVSNISRHSSMGADSTGRYGPSTPALLTSTRSCFGISMVSGLVTSRRLTSIVPLPAWLGRSLPAAGSRMLAMTSKPRCASSVAMARPMPRLAPVTRAVPSAFTVASVTESVREPIVQEEHWDRRVARLVRCGFRPDP